MRLTMPTPAASGNGAITVLPDAGRPGRAVPEPGRSGMEPLAQTRTSALLCKRW
jgi:hypothetical protein